MKNSKKISYAAAFASVFVLAFPLLGKDVAYFFRWWAALFLLGVAALPMTTYLFRGFHDKGYLFAKTIGLSLTGYLLWALSSIRIMKFTQVNSILCFVLLLLPNAYLVYLYRKKAKQNEPIWNTDSIQAALNEELVFLLLFVIWCYIKGFRAEASGTEKFMDYGFMTSMMRVDYMPPYDFWFSGGVINYYYFGQYLATFMTKLSGVSVNTGYNFMLMTITVLSTLLPYSIVTNLMKQFLRRKKMEEKQWLAYTSGALGGALLSWSSNMHYPIFRFIIPHLQEMLGIETKNYWFPDATRYIGYRPDTGDKTIHEFPSYSSVLGDLHAHYINIIFVVTVVGLLLAWQISKEKAREQRKSELIKLTRKDYLGEVFEPRILMITFFIGMFHMTNFWDFPIYYVVAGAVILCTNARTYRFNLNTIKMTAVQGVFVFLGSSIIALPFTLNFDQISNQICIATDHTPLYQLAILWALPIFAILCFLVACIREFREKMKQGSTAEGKNKKLCGFFQWIYDLDAEDLFVVLLGLCAIGLVILPEVIYVKDIYSSYKRANTMFKLTYQSFILFSMANGYAIMKLVALGQTHRQRRNGVAALILSIWTIGYIGHAIPAWFGNVADMPARKGMDAAAFVYDKLPEDAKAIDWLNEHISGHAVVLEAPGDSYTDYERVSVLTGLQTVVGWGTHEWLWRNDRTVLDQRRTDIETLYTCGDVNIIQNLAQKYDIDYIYIGGLEYDKYPALNADVLNTAGEVVYSGTQAERNTYIIKMK